MKYTRIWTSEKFVETWQIIAALWSLIYTAFRSFSSCKYKPEKSQARTGSNPWPLWFRYSALPIELSIEPSGSWSSGGPGLVSLWVRNWWWRRMQVNTLNGTWMTTYLNYEERLKDTIDYRSYAQLRSSCENNAWTEQASTGFEPPLCDTGVVLWRPRYQFMGASHVVSS